MSLIWSTRGRTWGFRFLHTADYADPLPIYSAAFSGIEDEPQAWRRVGATAELPELVALRFPDPEGRKDRAGRVIPHEFVLFPPEADEINSVEDGIRLIWPRVAEEFARVWDQS
jgi:hypothetical protein